MNTHTNNNKAVIYARFSSEMQRNHESIDLQVDACKAYAKKNDLDIIEVYQDEAISGTKSTERTNFMKMIKDAENGLFTKVIIYKYNRFSRNMKIALDFESQLEDLGVTLISATEEFCSSPQGLLLKYLTIGMAEMDIYQISENVLRGQKSKAGRCLHCGGVPPLGFALNKEQQLILGPPNEVEAIKMIFSLKAKGYSANEILQALDKKGINQNKKGLPIKKSSLHSIWRNQKYKGVYVFNKSASKSKNGKRNGHAYKNVEDQVIVPGGCPAIISDKLFDEVQSQLKRGKQTSGRSRSKRSYLLSGLVRCCCGASYIACHRVARPGHRAYTSYICNGRSGDYKHHCSNRGIEMYSLDDAVLNVILIFLKTHTAEICSVLNRQRQFIHEQRIPEKKRLSLQLESTTKKINHINTAIANGAFNEQLCNTLNTLNQQVETIQIQLDDLKKLQKRPSISEQDILNGLNNFLSYVSKMDKRHVQLLINELLKRVEIGKNDINIQFKIA